MIATTEGARRRSTCAPNPPRRTDLSWRYAMSSDLEAISYTVTLGRWKQIRDLKPRAIRVLRFFSALNRRQTASRGAVEKKGVRSAAKQKLPAQKNVKKAILECLRLLLSQRGRRGNVALGRAAMELSGGGIVGEEGTGVRWDYWIERWFKLTREEQSHVTRVEILPVLFSPVKGIPPAKSLLQGKRAQLPPLEPQKREPTEADTIRNLQSLESRGWGSELVASITRMLAIASWDYGAS